MLPGKGHQERPNVIGVHGQFWEDQEVYCLAVVTGHGAMRVSQPPHLIDTLKCRRKVRSVPESKRRVTAEVRSSSVAGVVLKIGNHRLDNANTQWPSPISGMLRSVGGRLLQEYRSAMGPILHPECIQAELNRCSDLSEAATGRQDARPGPPEKVVEQVFHE